MVHELKIRSEYFKYVTNLTKTFEVRKDDRDFQISDRIILREVDKDGNYTGFGEDCEITYILGRKEEEKQYVVDGYVIIGIKLL